ncbi:hypothetical protein AeNC1_017166, partial [Aphanomyces euteiches]
MNSTNATTTTAAWPANMTKFELWTLVGLPILSLVFIYVLLRLIWKVVAHVPLPTTTKTQYGSTDADKNAQGVLCEEGDVAGDYEESWTKTFDLTFLIGMVVYLVVMVVLTYIYHIDYFTNTSFWLSQLPKLVCMMVVSLIGGLICRCFCTVDDKGYIITNKNSAFKVNYTRKLQHFAAYMVPLVLHTNFSGPIALAWGDFFTMIGFLVLIKPIRESLSFFMLQFNSLDRPEDRPHTLK